MKLIKYVCRDCAISYPKNLTKGFVFYLEPQHNWEDANCPNCNTDKHVTNEGEIDAEKL
jgi:hypothetical protein